MNRIVASTRRAFRQPAFLVVVTVMALCAATMNTVVGFMSVHFKKLPVPLRVKSLREGIPHKLGAWVMVSTDRPLDADLEHVLVTSEYIFRDYVDSRMVAVEDIEKMRDATENQRNAMLLELRKEKPAAVIRMAVTYYTGLIDTVAHVPERCFVADGFEIAGSELNQATIGRYDDGKPRDLEYRFLNFEDQAVVGLDMPRVSRNVAYFFHCNGGYTASSLVVRRRLQSLLEPYGYYAKVELMTAATMRQGNVHGIFEANSSEATKEAMADFLQAALPVIEKCLPDWEALHRKK